MTIARYYHTLRYLRPEQILGRAWFRLYRPRIDRSPAPELRKRERAWAAPIEKPRALVGPDRVRLLAQTHDVAGASAWNDRRRDLLWLYHLHYFDDLTAAGWSERAHWHRALVGRWIAENAPGHGVGWDPYPTSRRIVNWIKWGLREDALPAAWRQSLATQLRWLTGRLEWHLLGNHLLANAKALLFGGCYFEGVEARRWLDKGFHILERALAEQILSDGGHFERSPMYHALVLEDLLDVVNVCRAFPSAVSSHWRNVVERLPSIATRMRSWLSVMCHPDGEIAFFNDAAIGMAPAPAEMGGYARRLDLSTFSAPADGLTHLSESGYIRVQQGDAVAFLDVAPVGPDYLPGHAHADTLSFEMSLFDRRVLVNSGTSCYGRGPERLRQRGTAAHNTVVVDDEDSSEVWHGFRVARRARPLGLELDEGDGEIRIRCAHDGYTRLPGRVLHRRRWSFSAGRLVVLDALSGRWKTATARYHLHPAVGLGGEAPLTWRSPDAVPRVEPSSYHPRFGVTEASRCVVLELDKSTCEAVFSWN